MLPNRMEHVLADQAVLHAGGVPVTFYATLAPDQIRYVAADCDVRIAVLDGASELARWQPLLADLPGLTHVIVRDAAALRADDAHLSWAAFAALSEEASQSDAAAEVSRRVSAIRPADPVTLLYTSGTTGNPKGVIITHGSVLYEATTAEMSGATMKHVRWVSYLPLAHIAERMFSLYLAIYSAGHSYFCHVTTDLVKVVGAEADAAVLTPIKSLLGLEQAVNVVSAAAPLPPEVAAFFAGLGMKILDVYGMTETTGAFTTNTPTAFRLGTVGRPVAGIEVKIADDGEILARGPLNTPGYLNLPEQTKALLDEDGWLHTGDIGTMDADGFVSVVDRKKELIITSGGENISPAAVETVLVANPLIGQALAFGDRRKFVVALLTLDGEVAPAWAKARGVDAASLAELAEHPLVLEAVGEAVDAANEQLARVQQVKRWRLLPVEWTADTEELTPTFKLKRRVIHNKYADVIDSLYAGAD